MKKFLYFFLVAILAITGCSNDTFNIPLAQISLNNTQLTLKVGATGSLVATLNPANTTEPQVIWSSSNQDVAIVDQNGLVSALKAGTAIISVSSTVRNLRAECTVKVEADEPGNIPVSSILIDKGSHTMVVGDAIVLIATVFPDNATNKEISWSTSNATVANVQNGVVSAFSAGTAVITATSASGNKSANCTITVVDKVVSVSDITLDRTNLQMKKGDLYVLKPTVLPANATNKNVNWTSSDPSVATVNNGLVIAIGKGSTAVIATTEDGNKVATCQVTVSDESEPSSTDPITLDKTQLTLNPGNVEVLTVSNAGNRSLVWNSSNAGVAVVANGVISAISAGTTVITVATSDGTSSAYCIVTVVDKDVAVAGVTLSTSNLNMKEGETSKLIATILPTNATNKNVSWISSNGQVASVFDGTVTAISAGSTTITVITSDGGYFASCQVTVSKNTVSVTGVKLNTSNLTIKTGESATLTATINPSDASNTNVLWTSSNTIVATVENGEVKGLSAGQSIITVTTVDGSKTDMCVVTVEQSGGTPGEGSDVEDGDIDIDEWSDGESYNI